MNDLQSKIQLAFLAIGGETWNKKNCQCDPDVGAVPCEYCAIHDALKGSMELVRELMDLRPSC